MSDFLSKFRNAVLGATMADLPAMMTASGWRLNEKGDYVLDLQNDPHVILLRDNLAAEGAGVMFGEFGLPAIHGLYNLGVRGLGKAGNNWARAKLINREMNDVVDEGLQYFGKVKYYGPTMGKTTAAKTNHDLADFDDVTRTAKNELAKKLNISPRVLQSDPKYAQAYLEMLEKLLDSWRRNPLNADKTLVISKKGLADKNVYNNDPSIPDRQTFILRLRNRGETDDANSNDWYNMLLKQNPNLKIDNRFISEIEYNPHYIGFLPVKQQSGKAYLKMLERPLSKLTEAERTGIPKGDRNNSLKTNPLAGVESEVDTYLINRTNTPFTFVDGKLVWMPGNARSGGSRATVHFTTDQPVIDHGYGSWSDASETFLTPYQLVVKDNGMPMNIEPMDTWFSNQYPFIIRQNGSRIFTSNPRNYYRYLLLGVDAETSKEALEIYRQILKAMKERDVLEQAFIKTGYLLGSPEHLALYKYSTEVLDPLLRKHDAVHRNWVKANNHRPTLDTYKQLEEETGLVSGVRDYYGKMDYYHAPPTHSNMWYDDILDAKQRFDTFLYLVIEYPDVIKQLDYLLFEQLARKYPKLVKDFLENEKGIDHWSGFKNIDVLPKEVQQILHNVYNRGYKTGGKLIKRK